MSMFAFSFSSSNAIPRNRLEKSKLLLHTRRLDEVCVFNLKACFLMSKHATETSRVAQLATPPLCIVQKWSISLGVSMDGPVNASFTVFIYLNALNKHKLLGVCRSSWLSALLCENCTLSLC